MQKFSGYDEARSYTDGADRLKLGGHICKIIEVKIDTLKTKDGKEFQQLVIKFDTEAPDEQAGYYQNKFAEDAKKDALNAKWKGYYRLSVPTDNSEDFVKSNFKTFITSVEKSNPGYKWNWEENQLVGKLFGGVFGFEEFVTQDGTTIPLTKCRFVRSIEKIQEVAIPKVRLADKTTMDYEEYIEMRKNKSHNDNATNTTEFEGSDNLPF